MLMGRDRIRLAFHRLAKSADYSDKLLGCISLAIWALTLIVGLKCAVFILRADNDGEGGVFALYSLLYNYREEAAYLPLLLAGLMLGAGFLCGETIISPAISVLAAVEGLEVATSMFRGAVIPITVVILALLTTGLLFLRPGRQCPAVRTNHARAPEVSHRPSPDIQALFSEPSIWRHLGRGRLDRLIWPRSARYLTRSSRDVLTHPASLSAVANQNRSLTKVNAVPCLMNRMRQ